MYVPLIRASFAKTALGMAFLIFNIFFFLSCTEHEWCGPACNDDFDSNSVHSDEAFIPLCKRPYAIQSAIFEALGYAFDPDEKLTQMKDACGTISNGDLQSIEHLSIRDRIEFLAPQDVASLNGLKKLDCDYCLIVHDILDGVFDNLPALEELNIGTAIFNKIPSPLTLKSNRLKSLRLHHFTSLEIPEDFHFNSPELQRLVFRVGLVKLPTSLLSGLSKLQHLDLSGNKLADFPVLILNQLPELTSLLLQDNAFDESAKQRISDEIHELNQARKAKINVQI